jgi:uncharacterized membrane protein YqaE (UPF0057 family)
MAMLMPLIPMVIPMIGIGIAIALFGEILITLITLLPKLFKLAMSIFTPGIFIRDLIFGIFTGIFMVLAVVGDFIKAIIETIFNTIFGQSNGGFFGHGNQKDPRTGKLTNPKNRICKRPPSIIHYIVLILCPPFYIFLKKGLSGWIYILIDILLTGLFYFPGLIYALIICPFCF